MHVKRVVREEKTPEGGSVVMERSGLGQVVEYDVYVVGKDGERTYMGGGSKSEARRVFEKAVK